MPWIAGWRGNWRANARRSRFYAIIITPTRFGAWALVRVWGWIGPPGTVRRISFQCYKVVWLCLGNLYLRRITTKDRMATFKIILFVISEGPAIGQCLCADQALRPGPTGLASRSTARMFRPENRSVG